MYTLTLSKEQLAVIGELLVQGPYKLVAPILTEIQKQVNEQETANVSKNSN